MEVGDFRQGLKLASPTHCVACLKYDSLCKSSTTFVAHISKFKDKMEHTFWTGY